MALLLRFFSSRPLPYREISFISSAYSMMSLIAAGVAIFWCRAHPRRELGALLDEWRRVVSLLGYPVSRPEIIGPVGLLRGKRVSFSAGGLFFPVAKGVATLLGGHLIVWEEAGAQGSRRLWLLIPRD